MKIFDCIKNKEKFTSIALAYLLCFSGLSYFINTLTEEVLGKGFSLDSIALYGLLILLVSFACLRNLSSISYVGAIVAFFFIFSYIVTLIAFPQNHLYMWTSFADYLGNPFYTLFFYSFTALLLAINLKDIDHLFGWLTFFSYVIIILAGIRYALGIEDPEGNGVSYMVFAYNILLPVVFLLLNNFRKFHMLSFLIGLIGLLELFLIGCRGALVSCLITVMLYVFFFGKINLKARVFWSAVLLVSTILLVFHFESIMHAFSDFADAINFDSRTLDYILRGRFFDDSGRGDIYTEILYDVSLFGKGFYADRLPLSGGYSHNLFVEILYAYGSFFGIILIGVLLILLIRALIKAKDRWSLLLCVLLATGFFKLMVTGSFLNQEPCFYALLGVAVRLVYLRSPKPSQPPESILGESVLLEKSGKRGLR